MSEIIDVPMQAERAAGELKLSESEERDRLRTCRARVPIAVFIYGYNPQDAPSVSKAT
jgi:hypothetical protein